MLIMKQLSTETQPWLSYQKPKRQTPIPPPQGHPPVFSDYFVWIWIWILSANCRDAFGRKWKPVRKEASDAATLTGGNWWARAELLLCFFAFWLTFNWPVGQLTFLVGLLGRGDFAGGFSKVWFIICMCKVIVGKLFALLLTHLSVG